jgi:hypothetical protein
MDTMDIDHFLSVLEKDNSDKFEMFNNWCQTEGVIMPKCEYPAYFENGLIGVKCKEDIHHREIYIYVPYKMLMSVKGTLEHPILGSIIQKYP